VSFIDPFDTPEKRYVRNHWLQAATKRKKSNNVEHINYLTLPGKNRHDVLLLKDIIKETKTGYDKDSLTFIEKDIGTYVDIRNKLPGAIDFRCTFERFIERALDSKRILPTDSEKYDPLKCFPYDVVNLDFTGSVFNHGNKEISPQMKAIHGLFEIQSFRRRSFTLFLTSTGIKKADDDPGRIAVNNAIEETFNDPNFKEFKETFDNRFPNVMPPYNYMHINNQLLKYKDFLLIGVPLIIINYGFSNKFDTKCVNRFFYVGEGNTALMLSFIFECEYISSFDYGGRSRQTIINDQPQRLCGIFDHLVDIKTLFKENPLIKTKYSENIT
jgi:hypothetical protein